MKSGKKKADTKADTKASRPWWRALVKRAGGHPTIGARFGVDASTSRSWETGRCAPSPATREAIFAALAVEVTRWDDAAASPAATSPRPSRKTPPKVDTSTTTPPAVPDACASSEDLLDFAIVSLKRMQADADTNVLSDASYRDKTASLGVLVTAVNSRAKLRGEDAATLKRFLASSWWKKIKHGLEKGLRSFPEAAASVAAEMQYLEDEHQARKGGQR